MPTSNEIRSNIIALLRCGLGFGVELFGTLAIDEIKKGYRVLNQPDPAKDLFEGEEIIFKDLKKAVDHFLKIREERCLGYDFSSERSALTDLVHHLEELNITPNKSDPSLVNIHGKIPVDILEKARLAVKNQ